MRKTEIQLPKLTVWLPDGIGDWKSWLPSKGSVLFTTLMIFLFAWVQSAGAFSAQNMSASSIGTIAYQGRLADSGGNPLTSTLNMSFRLYSAVTGSAPLWTEQWTGSNGVQVSDGLFNVMLGSLTPIPQSVIAGNSNLFLGITVGTDDEMSPRVQLGSVPFAMQALTVPDGSIVANKLADGSVTSTKLVNGSVTVNKLSNPITHQSWMAYCLTPHQTLCGNSVVSDFSKEVVGSNQLLRWTLPYSAFPNSLIGSSGKLDYADDINVRGSVPIAIVPEGNLLRCYAMVPSEYFNTVNSRVYLEVYGF